MDKPIPMLLWCPECGARHVDVGEFASKSHHSHACQHCGHVWRPAIVPTVGVQFLPGFKDPPQDLADPPALELCPVNEPLDGIHCGLPAHHEGAHVAQFPSGRYVRWGRL